MFIVVKEEDAISISSVVLETSIKWGLMIQPKWEIPWQSSGYTSNAGGLGLIPDGELRFHKLCGVTKKENFTPNVCLGHAW